MPMGSRTVPDAAASVYTWLIDRFVEPPDRWGLYRYAMIFGWWLMPSPGAQPEYLQ